MTHLRSIQPFLKVISPVQTFKYWVLLLGIFSIGAQSAFAQVCSCVEGGFTVGTGVSIPNLTVAAAQFPGFANLNNACVRVVGSFTIPAGSAWTTNNTNIYLAQNASIILQSPPLASQNGGVWNATQTYTKSSQGANINVQGNGLLNAQNSTFTPCSLNKWNGITVQTNGNLGLATCVVDRAITGVNALQNARFMITGTGFYGCNTGLRILSNQTIANHNVNNNLFYECNLGIYLVGATNVNIGANTYFERDQEFVLIGIESSGISTNVTVNGGQFIRQRHGVHALSAKNYTLLNATYHDCKTGIEMRDGFFSLTVSGNTFNNTIEHPIHVKNQTTTNGETLISGNTVNSSANSISSAIRVEEATGTGPLNIMDNLVNAGGAVIPSHIQVSGASSTTTIQGNRLGVGSGLSAQRGIDWSSNSGSVTFCCNDLNNSNTGLYINGTLNTGEVIRNIFRNHPTAGMHYDQVASTGPQQFLNGNDWRNYTGACPARFDGSVGVANATRFTVSLDFFPQAFGGVCTPFDPEEWFSIVADYTEVNCAEGGACVAGPGFGGGSDDRTQEEAVALPNSLKAYPNPSNQSLNLEFPVSEGATHIALMDIAGKVVYQESLPAGLTNRMIQTSKLAQGMYLLALRQDGKAPQQTKIMIAH
jgi:hypothetical protein